MNESVRKAMESYFDAHIAECRDQAAQLSADDRADEAVFAKVAMNVYDIFRTIFSVAVKSGNIELFRSKLAAMPQGWRASLESAEKNGDAAKAHIEQIKVATSAEIAAAFEKIMEEQHD